jgi:hypothetical protein
MNAITLAYKLRRDTAKDTRSLLKHLHTIWKHFIDGAVGGKHQLHLVNVHHGLRSWAELQCPALLLGIRTMLAFLPRKLKSTTW